jgi:RHS repeat-associated protein
MTNDPNVNFITTANYLATGEVTSVSQAHGGGTGPLLRWMQYDSLGRMVLNAEPNTSVNFSPTFTTNLRAWRYAYNDNGELVGTSDARGCGENLSYDKLGRLIAEDYSPCEGDLQPPYTLPNLTTGDGTEVFYRYDTPEVFIGDASVYNGRLTAIYDRSQHARIFLDPRGRPSFLERQLAKPGLPAPALTARYAPHFFKKQFTYDEANRVLTETTGAESPELSPPQVGSSVSTGYAPGGAVAWVSSTYGGLLSSQQVDANGAVLQLVFGDIAGTTFDFNYYVNNLVKEIYLHRRPGPWLSPGGGYTVPGPGDPNTLQGDLFRLSFQYDGAGNPTSINDLVDPGPWPAGAKPASRSMIYDDMYRLRELDINYGGGDDTFVSPFAPEARRGDPTYPPLIAAPNRVRQQTFQHDPLGNAISSSDDAQIFFDRSLGTTTYGALNSGPHRLLSASRGQSSLSVDYDGAGNVTGITVQRPSPCTVPCQEEFFYTWDEVGNLSGATRRESSGQITNTVAQTSYSYDASGNRLLTTRLDPVLNQTLHRAAVFNSLRLENATFPDPGGNYERSSATENVYLTSNGATLAHVLYDNQSNLPTGPAGRVHVSFGFSDYLGSTSVVIDRDTGELMERSTYHGFGAPESDYRPDRWGNFRERYRYTGHEDDSDVGLSYFGRRYYSPAIGTWISPDPLTIHGLASDINPYAFVSRSPMRFADPFGLDTYGCDNLNPNCESSSWDPATLLNGIASAFNGGTGGSGSGRAGGSAHSPSPPPAPGQVSAAGGSFGWNLASPEEMTQRVAAFNTGVDKHAPELVGAGALALAQSAIVTGVAGGLEALGGIASRFGSSLYRFGSSLYVNAGRAIQWFTVGGTGAAVSARAAASELEETPLPEEATAALEGARRLGVAAPEGRTFVFNAGLGKIAPPEKYAEAVNDIAERIVPEAVTISQTPAGAYGNSLGPTLGRPFWGPLSADFAAEAGLTGKQAHVIFGSPAAFGSIWNQTERPILQFFNIPLQVHLRVLPSGPE